MRPPLASCSPRRRTRDPRSPHDQRRRLRLYPSGLARSPGHPRPRSAPHRRRPDRVQPAFRRPRLGPLSRKPAAVSVAGHPEIYVVSNVVENGVPIGSLGAGEAVWHTDMSYLEDPPKASMLYALEIPPDGGNTYFCSMYPRLRIAARRAPAAHRRPCAEARLALHTTAAATSARESRRLTIP